MAPPQQEQLGVAQRRNPLRTLFSVSRASAAAFASLWRGLPCGLEPRRPAARATI
jgi:hypothetical protein